MKIAISNSTILISNPTSEIVDIANDLLTYSDKSKAFQLKRMSRNPYLYNSAAYQAIKDEAEGSLYETLPDGSLVMSSAFWYLFKDVKCDKEDNRIDTGNSIPLPWVKKPHDLRPYQQEALDLMISNWRGLINLATGLGKTLLAVHVVKHLKKKALIVCPNESIAKQFYTELCSAFGENKIGYYGGGKKKIKDITVGIAASINNGVKDFEKANLGVIIYDEVHHIAATTFLNIAKALSNAGRIYGLTATDYRADGKDIVISSGCGNALIRRDARWGIDSGWLAKPIFIVRNVKTSGRDYSDDKLKNYKEHVLNSREMKTQILDDITNFLNAGKAVVCLVNEVAHGAELAGQLKAPFATGKDSKSMQYIKDFNDGKTKILIATSSKAGEGTDIRPTEVLVLANFAGSKGIVMQTVGRGLRKQGTKTHCIILDYVPKGSKMLTRHAANRIKLYKTLTDKVKVI